jgi:POT family proton-dependent oligopeptide transporter
MSQVSTPTAPLSPQSSDYGATDPEIAMVEVSGLLARPWERPVEEELPTNVNSTEQLKGLPEECLTGDPTLPLQHVEDDGTVHRYPLSPMFYSVIFILLVELLERFSFYGLTFTQTLYLTGAYNKDWNAGMTSVSASSFVSVSVAIAYTSPFFGAFLADKVFGDYFSILFGVSFFYLPGLVLIALTSVPNLLGSTFNVRVLTSGLLFFWPMGTGVVKSLVNIFGAKQFHPLLQTSLIESYYVFFYMAINIGAFAGILLIPFVAQTNVTVAYWIPPCALAIGVAFFASGTSRYVRNKPKHAFWEKKRKTKKKKVLKAAPSSSVGLSSIFRICCLIIPFSIVYSQMATTFIVQGTVMKRAFGFIDAASMNCFDTISVLSNGYLIGGVIYPALASRGIKVPTTYKFAIGSGFAALAITWALFVEQKVHRHYGLTGEEISVLWQVPSFALVGIGEIFAVSSAYEVAFTAAPPDKKGISSALNLFCIGGIPNILCLGLYHVGARWFTNAKGTTSISEIEDYVTANVSHYFAVLLMICFVGIGINLLPAVRDWVESIEDDAAEAIKTPAMTPTPRTRRAADDRHLDEKAALLGIKRHRNYMKAGSKPQLLKSGSFRAGAVLKMAQAQQKKNKPARYVKFGHGLTLYKKNAGALESVVRSQLDSKTEHGIRALEEALEGKGDINDPRFSTSTT